MQRLTLLATKTLHEFGEDRCSHMAAAMSYYALFSLFPLVIFAVSVASFFFSRDEVVTKVFDGINQVVPVAPGGETNITSAVDSVLDARGPLSVIALVGMAWSGSALFGALRASLDVAWDVQRGRPFIQQKLVDLAAVSGIGVLFVLSVAGTAVLQIARTVSEQVGPLSQLIGLGWDVVFLLLPALFSLVAFAVIYRFVPAAPVRWRDALAGALVATALFEAAKNGFALYLRNFPSYDETYGSLGAVVAFLFWVYLSGIVLLLGAELAAELPRVVAGEYDAEEAERARFRTRAQGVGVVGRLGSIARGLVFGSAEPAPKGSDSRSKRR